MLNELERWQNVILDREAKVAELKPEINVLCRELGQQVRYLSIETAIPAGDY